MHKKGVAARAAGSGPEQKAAQSSGPEQKAGTSEAQGHTSSAPYVVRFVRYRQPDGVVRKYADSCILRNIRAHF